MMSARSAHFLRAICRDLKMLDRMQTSTALEQNGYVLRIIVGISLGSIHLRLKNQRQREKMNNKLPFSHAVKKDGDWTTFIQWKGTDVCMDWYCPLCGNH